MVKQILPVRKFFLVVFLTFALSPALAADLNSKWLDPWFAGYNQKYFNSELPDNTKIVHTLADPQKMAETEWYPEPGLYVIRLNVKFEPAGNRAQMTLLRARFAETGCSGHVVYSWDTADSVDREDFQLRGI